MKSTGLGAILIATVVSATVWAQPNTTPPPGGGSGSGTGSGTGTGTGAGTGSGSATEPVADTEGDDVDTLRQEYLQLRDELYQSRARVAAVSSALYSTKVSIKLQYTSGRFYGVDRAVIRLDRGTVYDDTTGAIASDDAVRFEGFIAPGKHQITMRVETTGKDDERFTSAVETTFIVEAVDGKDLVVVAKAKDGGDIPYAWKKGEHGSYKLSIDADIKTVANGSEAPKAKKTAAVKKTHKKGTRRAASR